MKIGILTFFSSINNGAFLQAYSLQEYLKKRYGKKARVQMINYISEKSWKFYEPTEEARKISFYKCWKKLDLTENQLITDDLELVAEYIKECAFDVVIVGSDEVWKTDGLRGFPTAYWLNFDIGNAIRISYAASARNDYQLMSAPDINYIRESLDRFSYIGVRDEITKAEILGIKQFDIHMNCDPTILNGNIFRFSNKERYDLRRKWSDENDKKLVVLMIQNHELSNHLYRMLRNENTVYDLYEWAGMTDRKILAISPFDWSELIAVADCVITSLFHGTVFSMIHDTPFISIDLAEPGRGKVTNILTEHGLQDKLFLASDYKESQKRLGMAVYTKCQKILKTDFAMKYEDILEEEARKADSFTLFMDDLLNLQI